MNDISTQINAVTEFALMDLKKKFPNNDFKVILRDFASSITIKIREAQQNKLIENTIDTFVTEEFCPNTISDQATEHYTNKETVNYENMVLFLKELRYIPLFDEMVENVGREKLIDWAGHPESHGDFFRKLETKHPKLFSYLDRESAVKEMENLLIYAVERKYRSEEIQNHVGSKKGIAETFEGIMDWQINESTKWFSKIKSYVPNFDVCGFQKITVAEIVPKGLDNYFGALGGKTVKFGTYTDLRTEMTLSQRDLLQEQKVKVEPERFKQLADNLFSILIARRYIFPEAINMILDSDESYFKMDLTEFRDDNKFKEFAYKSFMEMSVNRMNDAYQIYNLLPDNGDVTK